MKGLDFAKIAIQYCKRRGLENVHIADLNIWIPESNRYDLITCNDVLCHKGVRDEVDVLKLLASGLKDGGVRMLNYPAFPILSRNHDEVVMIRNRYTKKQLREILAKAGLDSIRLSYRLPHAFLVLILKRVLELIGISKSGNGSDIAQIPSPAINNLLDSTRKCND